MVYTSSGQSKAPAGSHPLEGSRFLWLALLGEAALLVLAWVLGRWTEIRPLEQLRLDPRAAVLGVAGTVPLLLGLTWILRTEWRPARDLVSLVTEHLGPLLAGRSAAELALLSILAGVGEEILFRGVVQVGLARVLAEHWALLAASAIFGLSHFASQTYAVFAALVGVYLGGLFLLTGNLLVPIVAHALYDFVALKQVVRSYHARVVEGD